MAYFERYYLEFQDNAQVAPITWRVVILDSEGNAPTEPYQLTPSASPLITKRIDISEDKFATVIGKQVVISYEYTGAVGEPLPEDFFEANEMRFRANVYKDGVLDGVYYIKPDFSSYPDVYAPVTISLTAVDGLSYTKGMRFNSYEDGLIYYEKIPWYEALMTRGLFQIFDVGTPIVVLNTMKPVDADGDFRLLFDTYVHTDAFFDFVEGPLFVYDVLEQFCRSFKGRLFTDENKVWFQRIQDLKANSYSIDTYTDDTTVTTTTPSGFVRTIGPGFEYDGIPTGVSGFNRMLLAVKEANFETEYKGINQLDNFDWSDWTGSSFVGWSEQNGPIYDRRGSGTLADPWLLFWDATSPVVPDDPAIGFIQQAFDVLQGDIIDINVKVNFYNCKQLYVNFHVFGKNDGLLYAILVGGQTWKIGGPLYGNETVVGRSGNKRTGTLSTKTDPIPLFGGTIPGADTDYELRVRIGGIPEITSQDGPALPGAEVYPIKVGAIALSSKGRHVQIINAANFSAVRPDENFFFIDTGEDGVSNTIFWDDGVNPIRPVTNSWTTDKPGVNPGDLERYMAISVIDQYQRSVTSWESSVDSNAINYYNVIELWHKVGKTFLQLSDEYNNRTCRHEMVIAELFEERATASNYDYTEWDIEEEND